jgi:hypothetical protein|uniref:hypothetical protein n=1 Tax=Polynucleobacter sp. TaxID=2029855 RepID=UPI004048997A
MRGTSSFTQELQAQASQPGLAVVLNLDSGIIRLWSGIGDLVYAGDTYTGVGNLLSVRLAEESKEIAAKGVNVALNGINSTLIAKALDENYRGRTMAIYLFFMDDNQVVLYPYAVFVGYINMMNIQDNGETSVISVDAESKLIDLQRPRERRYTSEDQKIDYPNDKGLDAVTWIQNQKIKWGSGSPRSLESSSTSTATDVT